MKMLLTATFLLSGSILYAAPECDYHLQVGNPVLQVEENSQVVQGNIEINRGQNSPDGRCKEYRVFFSKGLANSYQRRAFTVWGNSITYNLHENINQAGILKDYGDALNANEFLEGEAPDKFTVYNKSYFISVPGLSSNMVSSGTYTDILQASIYGYNSNSGNYLFEDADTVTVVFYIPKRIQISLVDEGGTFDASSTSKVMDFGILSQNQEKGADLRVVSNGSYQVRISSQNNGKLKLPQGETINYALRVNNNTVSLSGSSSSSVQIGSGDMTSSGGDRYNLKVKIIESTANKSAGMYQDILTITAIAN